MSDLIEIYPEVTADTDTWPVLCRISDPDTGELVVARDPGPYHRKQLFRALREREKVI